MAATTGDLISFAEAYFEAIKQNKILYALLILASFYIFSRLFVWIIEKIILNVTKKTKTDLDDAIVNKLKAPVSLLLLFIGIKLAIIPLDIHTKAAEIIYEIITTLIIGTITYGVIGVVYALIVHWKKEWVHKTKSKIDDHLIVLLNGIAKYVIGLIGLMFILQAWGVQIGPLLASLGIAGIAVAFALQTTLGNVFGGASLVVDQTIKVGDVIRLETGELGKIVSIGVRSTKILTPENVTLSIPNGKLADSKIQNISSPDLTIRVALDIGVEYGSEPDKVKLIIWQELTSMKDVLKEPKPQIFFMEMGDFALKFKVFFWIDDLDKKFDATDEATTRIYKALNKSKIGIPFPTRTVYLKK